MNIYNIYPVYIPVLGDDKVDKYKTMLQDGVVIQYPDGKVDGLVIEREVDLYFLQRFLDLKNAVVVKPYMHK